MAELINATYSGDRTQFFEALKNALSGFHDFDDPKNILPVVYDILSEKFEEADRTVAASKNDNYVSLKVADELIIRSKNVGDKLLNESAFKIDRVGLTSSTQLYIEKQRLSKGTTSIVLANFPSDTKFIQIANLNSKGTTQTINVLAFDELTNTITTGPLVQSGLYNISYTTTGDLFASREIKTFSSSPSTQIPLLFPRILFGSEKIYPTGQVEFIRDIHYVINYVDGIVDFLNVSPIANREIVFEYDYRRDLLKDVLINSHVPVTNETATPDLIDPFSISVRNGPVQDVTRIQNITSGETYTAVSVSNNTVRFTGTNAPLRADATLPIEVIGTVVEFGQERSTIQAQIVYPEGITPLNHPLVQVNSLTSETKSIRLTTANEIITGRDSTVYRRIRQDETIQADATSVVLDFDPAYYEQVQIYLKSDITETNLITPVSYDSVTRQFSFIGITLTDEYVVKYDTLQWLIYVARDVSTLTIKTGGVLLRSSVKRLIEGTDYAVAFDNQTTMRLTFMLSGAEKVKNTSCFYVLEKVVAGFDDPVLVNNQSYEFSFHEALKNELTTFTADPLDVIPLIKLERFRDRGQFEDTVINPSVYVFSLDGVVEYVENLDFIINYITKTIKRVDGGSIAPFETIKIFYKDEEITTADFTFIAEVIQIDYEYGDNTISHSPTIIDTPTTQLEALQAGVTQVILDSYPADWSAVQIINTLFPNQTPVKATAFDATQKLLSFPAMTEDGTYQFAYDKREQVINEGTVYYVSYRYGARRDALQDYFAYVLNLDIGQVFRQDEFLVASSQASQVLDYQPIDYTKLKIYARDDQLKTSVTTILDYNYTTNTVTFEPIVDAGAYIFEYYTFRRNVEQLRAGIKGLLASLPSVPKQTAFEQLIGEYTSTAPEIEIISKRFKIGRRIVLTEDVQPGDTFLPVVSAEDLPPSGTVTIYDNNFEQQILYSFITSGKLQGVPPLGFGSIRKSHSAGARLVIAENAATSYKLSPAPAKESPDLSDGTRSILFVSSKFETALLTEASRKSYVNYKAVNNINIEEGTISFWTGTRYDGDDGDTHYYFDTGTSEINKNRLSVYKNNKGYLVFEIRDSNAKLMSVRANVKRRVTTELIPLQVGQTEVQLSQMPSFSVADDDNDGISELFDSPETDFIIGLPDGYGGIIPGTEVKVFGWNRETNRLIIEPIEVADTYFLSYVIGFVNFDETEHFIETAWKTHVKDGLPPRMKMFIDGKKFIQNLL